MTKNSECSSLTFHILIAHLPIAVLFAQSFAQKIVHSPALREGYEVQHTGNDVQQQIIASVQLADGEEKLFQ